MSVKAISAAEAVDEQLHEVTSKILSRITISGMTQAQKLRACWNYSYWPKYPDMSSAGWYRNVYGSSSYDINYSIQRLVIF